MANPAIARARVARRPSYEGPDLRELEDVLGQHPMLSPQIKERRKLWNDFLNSEESWKKSQDDFYEKEDRERRHPAVFGEEEGFIPEELGPSSRFSVPVDFEQDLIPERLGPPQQTLAPAAAAAATPEQRLEPPFSSRKYYPLPKDVVGLQQRALGLFDIDHPIRRPVAGSMQSLALAAPKTLDKMLKPIEYYSRMTQPKLRRAADASGWEYTPSVLGGPYIEANYDSPAAYVAVQDRSSTQGFEVQRQPREMSLGHELGHLSSDAAELRAKARGKTMRVQPYSVRRGKQGSRPEGFSEHPLYTNEEERFNIQNLENALRKEIGYPDRIGHLGGLDPESFRQLVRETYHPAYPESFASDVSRKSSREEGQSLAKRPRAVSRDLMDEAVPAEPAEAEAFVHPLLRRGSMLDFERYMRQNQGPHPFQLALAKQWMGK